jgi:hypothetical protein
MKKLILVSAVCLFIATLSFGGNDEKGIAPGFTVIQHGPVLKLLYKGTKSSKVKVSILDSKMHSVFSETMSNTEGFVRPYNLSKLPAGEYVIEVTDESGSSSKTVVVKKKKSERSFKVSKVHGDKGKVLLTIGRLAGAYQIQIVDRHGEIVYKEQRHLNNDFAQVYDISSLKGDVTVIVNDSHGNQEKFEF